MLSSTMQKNGYIEIMDFNQTNIAFKLEFANAYATSQSFQYDAYSNLPLQSNVTVIAGAMRVGKEVTYLQTWNPEDPFIAQTTPIFIEKNEILAFDEQTKVIDKNGNPINDFAYCIEFENEIIYSGRTDRNGLTQRIEQKENKDDYSFYWGDEALIKNKNIQYDL